MVAQQFISMVNEWKLTTYIGLEDFVDKLSFLFSLVVILSIIVITQVKTYISSAIECYIPTMPGGSNFDDFLKNYCWVHGTIPILAGEQIPSNLDEWIKKQDEHRIGYYQWIPFVLALQALMFYFPRLIWQAFCYNRTGTDLEGLIETTGLATNKDPAAKQAVVKHVARTLEMLFFQHREIKSGRLNRAKESVYSVCNFCVISKRLGNWLCVIYLLIKVLYAANAILQLFIMHYFLDLNKHEGMGLFGLKLLGNLINGRDWDETRVFPRVSFCHTKDIRHLGASISVNSQCVLPVNMLYEKVYIFLWFWTLFVAIMSVVSLPIWLSRMLVLGSRKRFVKKYLRVSESYTKATEDRALHAFIMGFLRHDGIFLLRMMSYNCGDMITCDVVTELWRIYKEKYSNANFSRYQPHLGEPDHDLELKLPLGEKPPMNGKMGGAMV